MGLVVENVHDQTAELAVLVFASPILVPQPPEEVLGQKLVGELRQQLVGRLPLASVVGVRRTEMLEVGTQSMRPGVARCQDVEVSGLAAGVAGPR